MKNFSYLLVLIAFTACQQNQPSTPAATAPDNTPSVNEAVKNVFEEVNVVKMHLFATQETAPNADNYPYVGKAVGKDLLPMLGEGLQPSGEFGVFTCYYTENGKFFILRVPGKYVSGDLALARWDATANKLAKVTDLAYIQCDEGVCHQQDAWLTDLDDSRTLELILKSRHTENGALKEEQFTVMTEDGKGGFVQADAKLTSLAIKDNYVMQNPATAQK
jgi:hypothetical protein